MVNGFAKRRAMLSASQINKLSTALEAYQEVTLIAFKPVDANEIIPAPLKAKKEDANAETAPKEHVIVGLEY